MDLDAIVFSQSRERKKKWLTDKVSVIAFQGQTLRELVSPKVVQQKPDAQPIYSFNEQKAPKTVSQPVGTLNTKSPSIKEILNPNQKQNESGTDSPIEVKENRPLDLENLLMYWRKFAHQIKDEKASVFPMLTKRDPKIINDNSIIYEVDSEWVKGLLMPEVHDLLLFLKHNLKNGTLKFELRVLDQNQQTVNPYNPKEKFKLLAEKNPNLQMLQRMFNLDIDL